MKARRQAKILEFIENYSIDTQDELLRRLRNEGFDVTQATVSRDIKEMRIIKNLSHDGKYRYSTGKEEVRDSPAKFYSLFSDAAVSVTPAGNMVAVKCHTGMAQAVCTGMDSVIWEGVAGTLAGDDTIFVLCKDEACAVQFAEELKGFLRGR